MPISLDNQPKSPSNIYLGELEIDCAASFEPAKAVRENKLLTFTAPQPFQRPKTRRMLEQRRRTSRESLLRLSRGVMECWSSGVIYSAQHSNTPLLQYSMHRILIAPSILAADFSRL